MSKRKDYISWDEYFMGIARLSAMRSKDPNTQVGACIVDQKNRICATGYNGFPTGCDDDIFPWGNDGEFIDTKYPYVVHAEANAVLNRNSKDLEGCRIYTTLFPCHECTKLIIQSRIREIIFQSNKYEDSDSHRATLKMLEAIGIPFRQFPDGKN